ncbi:MAG: Farnesyl diphosphate synthase [Firmicutes bacterium]|nr:Farnesyl diphosphate synthase [candidate division NPL-UPA2 bacterium]
MKRFDLARYKALVDEALEIFLPGESEHPATIHQAMRYSLFPGGKRLRPSLALAVHEMFGGNPAHFLPAAAAVECVHTYSLVHDDLPVMDNDDYRRGRLTTHKVYGEAMAILAGDALLTLAFELMTHRLTEYYSAARVLNSTAELAFSAGTYGLVGGQVVDILATNREITNPVPTLEYIHAHKTGALITVAARIGAILAGATKSELTHITRYATQLGLGFQIRDDILDAQESETGKLTYVSIYGLQGAEEKVRRCFESCLAALEPLAGNFALQQAADLCLNRKS